MRRIRIEAKRAAPSVSRRDRYPVLPLDARDPAIVRAKRLLRDGDRPARSAVS